MNNVTSPRTDDHGIEQEIQAKGLTAPRIKPSDIEDVIVSCYFFTAEDGVTGEEIANKRPCAVYERSLSLLTFCILVLRNGFTVTGESACASPENFDADIGKKVARENAVQKLWPLLGYELKSKLHQL
jgi:hypothetical protein